MRCKKRPVLQLSFIIREWIDMAVNYLLFLAASVKNYKLKSLYKVFLTELVLVLVIRTILKKHRIPFSHRSNHIHILIRMFLRGLIRITHPFLLTRVILCLILLVFNQLHHGFRNFLYRHKMFELLSSPSHLHHNRKFPRHNFRCNIRFSSNSSSNIINNNFMININIMLRLCNNSPMYKRRHRHRHKHMPTSTHRLKHKLKHKLKRKHR